MSRRTIWRLGLAAAALVLSYATRVVPAGDTVASSALDAARRAAPAALGHRSSTQVYISPHADDETLTMGAAIAADVAAGRRVVVVLVTTGSSNRTAAVLDRVLVARHLRPLTLAAFTAARTREFDAATAGLGVAPTGLWHLGLADPLDNAAPLDAAVDRIVARYGPDAGYNSMSFMDLNPTHYHLAYRLDRLCADGVVRECHFYQFLRYQPGAHRPGLVDPVETPIGDWVDDRTGRVARAARAYAAWDPAHGRYGIGWLWSVTDQFDELVRTPRSWTHGTSVTGDWPSEAQRRVAEDWLATRQPHVDLGTVPGLSPPR